MATYPSVSPAGPPDSNAAGAGIRFWELPGTGGGSIVWTPVLIEEARAATLEALMKVLASGVEEYHVGSRGLKRLSLEDLRKLLDYWTNAAAAVSPSGVVSAIQTRRGVPCDV